MTTSLYFLYSVEEIQGGACLGSKGSLGEFEQLVLLAVLRLGRDAYGTRIREEIELATDSGVAIGALYTTLDRLQGKGLVTSEFGEATPERGGRAKRFFTVTPKGGEAVRKSLEAINRLAAAPTTIPGGAL